GIVFKQSFKNTITIYVAFAIGGINALFLYTAFLEDTYYGLVTYLLSTANILMPLTAFGVQYTILKFFSSYTSQKEKDTFLSTILWMPLLIAIPFGFLGNLFYESITTYLSLKNPVVASYTYLIYLVAIATAYFEIFYAWAKVHLQSVFGNILKELFSRVSATLLLLLVFMGYIAVEDFVYYLTATYFLRTFVMMWHAFHLYKPKFVWQVPDNFVEIIRYSFYIILAGAAGTILIDIDKFMIPQKEALANTAYYAVAVYIGSVVETPGRAMSQIMQPLVAKALNTNQMDEVEKLYKQSSINLLLIAGLLFLLINLNITEMYALLPKKYSGGILVVLCISAAKLYHMFLGANGAIISNSKYYRVLLPYGVLMALSVVVLNHYLIDLMSINGAALATFIVVYVFNTIKLYYVYRIFKLHPLTIKTAYLLILVVITFLGFYFWSFEMHPLLNILAKSVLIAFFYVGIAYVFNISSEVNKLIEGVFKLNSHN
ncbi:MAG: lipopolysaccharide biosynthesis protein, partial [Flavicella sp.]